MFERFTGRARRVVVLAQDEARRLRHNYIGTEHLLLGLIREEEGVAAQALGALGVTLDGAREQVEIIVGYGGEDDLSQAPFSPRSKKVLERALRESLQLGHGYIGTEHLLLGLLAEPEGVAAMVFSNLGVDPEAARQEVVGRLYGSASEQEGLGPLGWTREALRRSFGRYPRTEDRASFERFTELARRAVVLAQDEARHFHHDYIGTEHLLLGLLREEDGIASRVLRSLGVRPDEARDQLESLVGYGEGTGAQAPFTPRVQEVLRLATEEASVLGHDYVGTEHVLLGLVGEGQGLAVRMLSNLGVDPDEVRRGTLAALAESSAEARRPYLGNEPFHTRIEGIELRARCGREPEQRTEPRLFRVDLDVVHEAPGTVDAGVLIEGLKRGLEPTGFTLVESLVERIGELVLQAFPGAEQVTVAVAPETSTGETFTVSTGRTFRRR